jgi:hypothetical protein
MRKKNRKLSERDECLDQSLIDGAGELLDDRAQVTVGAGGRGPEFVLVDLDGGGPLIGAHHTPAGDQFQRYGAVELRRPANGDLQTLAWQQVPICGEQNAVAAHVERLSNSQVIPALPVENLVADLPLDGEAIRASAIVFIFFQSHSQLP